MIKYHIASAGFPFMGSLIHTFIGGSELHGAKLHGTDDLDIYGLYIEPPQRILGLDGFEHFCWSTAKQSERNGPSDVDITLYSLRKWAGLACKGNPTALNFLFAVNHTDNIMTWGTLAPQVRRCVLAKSCSKQFMGFVDAQMGRLLGTRGRGKKGQRPELEEKFGYDVKAGMHSVRLLYECIELMRRHEITFPRPERELLIEIRSGGWSLDKLSDHVNKLFDVLKLERERSSLPDEPDRLRLSEIIAATYLEYWERSHVQREALAQSS